MRLVVAQQREILRRILKMRFDLQIAVLRLGRDGGQIDAAAAAVLSAVLVGTGMIRSELFERSRRQVNTDEFGELSIPVPPPGFAP
jgi:hypothetical protein